MKRRAAVSIAELLADGVPVHPTEAVAIVRRLCATVDDQPSRVSHPTKIVLLADGELLTGTGRERSAPATAVLATVLQALVDRAPLGHRPPAGLSEVAACALGVPGTVGFETAAAFATALQCFEGPDPKADLRALFARWRAMCDLAKDLPEATQTVQLALLDATGSSRRSVVVRKPDRRRHERVVFRGDLPEVTLVAPAVQTTGAIRRAFPLVETRGMRELAIASAILLTVVPTGLWFAGSRVPSREPATVVPDSTQLETAAPDFAIPMQPDASFTVKPELVAAVGPGILRPDPPAPLQQTPPKLVPRRTGASMPRPFWFPDGKRMGYSRGSVLRIVEVKNGRTREFSTPRRSRIGSIAVSPDNHRVVFRAGREGTWLLDLKGDGVKQMRRIPVDPSARSFVWSPDGKRLAYYNHRQRSWVIQELGARR